jgi:hypothetical protein
VNSRFLPQGVAAPGIVSWTAASAMVTASYAPDFERCRLLCETVDLHVTGMSHHYILVERNDVTLFRQLETKSRTVVDERELLPPWLHAVNDPASLFRRRIWLSWKTMPLRGWHVQQLRRIAIAAHAAEDILVYCDSDVVFLKPFDCAAFRSDGRLRLFRRHNALPGTGDHTTWSRNAGAVLGIEHPAISPHDYISTLIAWSRRDVQAMCAQIERLHGRHWIEVVGSSRKFSECMIYGRFVDEVLAGAGHFHASDEFCRVHWTGSAMSDDEFRRFVADMSPHQVAIGMQSFIGTDIERIRRLMRAA